VLATSGVVLGAWYMLSLIRRVFFGPLVHREHAHPVHDLTWREIIALTPLCAIIVWIGVQPGFFLQRMAPALDKLSVAANEKLQKEDMMPADSTDKKSETAVFEQGSKSNPTTNSQKTTAELARVH